MFCTVKFPASSNTTNLPEICKNQRFYQERRTQNSILFSFPVLFLLNSFQYCAISHSEVTCLLAENLRLCYPERINVKLLHHLAAPSSYRSRISRIVSCQHLFNSAWIQLYNKYYIVQSRYDLFQNRLTQLAALVKVATFYVLFLNLRRPALRRGERVRSLERRSFA